MQHSAAGLLAAVLLAGPAAARDLGPDLAAGRERLRLDAVALDDPVGVEKVAWPAHSSATNLKTATASLIRQLKAERGGGAATQQATEDATSSRWAEMRGLVDGLEKDSQAGIADPAFARVVVAEQQVDKAAVAAKAQAEAAKEAHAMRSERLTGASDLDLSAATQAIDNAGQQMHEVAAAAPVRSQKLNWSDFKHKVATVADSNDGIEEHLWEQRMNRDLGDFAAQAGLSGERANIKADQGERARSIDKALQARAKFYKLTSAGIRMPAARPPKHAVAFLGTQKQEPAAKATPAAHSSATSQGLTLILGVVLAAFCVA